MSDDKTRLKTFGIRVHHNDLLEVKTRDDKGWRAPVKDSCNTSPVCVAAIGNFGRGLIEIADSFPGRTVLFHDEPSLDELPGSMAVFIDVPGRKAADADEISSAVYESRGLAARALAGAETVVIVADLSELFARGAVAMISAVAREHARTVVGFAALPFEFQADAVRRGASSALEDWRLETHALVVMPPDKLGELLDEDTPVDRAAEVRAAWAAGGVRAIAAAAAEPLRISPDALLWADFLGEGALCHAGWGSVPAGNALETAAILAMERSFLSRADLLSAGSVLVTLVASETPVIGEVNKVAEIIRARCGEDAEPRFLFARDVTAGDSTLCAVFASRSERDILRIRRPAAPRTKGKISCARNGAGIFGLHNRRLPRHLNLDVPTWLRRKSA